MQARAQGLGGNLNQFTGEPPETACLQDLGENKGIWKEDTECHFKVNLIKEGISAGAGMGLPTGEIFYLYSAGNLGSENTLNIHCDM